MKKIIIAIITLLASVGLAVGINSETYALQVGDVEYMEIVGLAYECQHFNFNEANLNADIYGYPTLKENSSVDLGSISGYWNNSTYCLSIIVLSNTIGFANDLPGEEADLVVVTADDGLKTAFIRVVNSKAGTRAILFYDGLNELDITTDIINDEFIGYILNVQLLVNAGTTDINTTIYTFQTLQWVNNSLNIISYPNYYLSFNVQSFGANVALLGNKDNTLETTNTYSSYYTLLTEYNSNLIENNAPITNKTVWSNLAKNHINYLSSTIGLPIVGYDASKVNANYYQEGFNSGKETGYELGYSEGLEKGQNAGTSWIATISQGVGHVLSLEIAPHLPLGLLVAIPLVMGMIGLILRFWRKD